MFPTTLSTTSRSTLPILARRSLSTSPSSIASSSSSSLSLFSTSRRPNLPVLWNGKKDGYATIAFPAGNAANASSSAASVTEGTGSKVGLPSLNNIEASWKHLSPTEQEGVFRHLEELQKKDWKELSNEEKRAAYYVAFGPHGPREPLIKPGQTYRSVLGFLVCFGLATGLYGLSRHFGGETPKTFTKEYQEQMTQRSIEQKMDPFTGPGSEGYKGKGFVQSVPGLGKPKED